MLKNGDVVGKVLATSLVLCYTTNVAKKHVCGFLPRCLSRDRSFVRLRRRVKHTEEKTKWRRIT